MLTRIWILITAITFQGLLSGCGYISLTRKTQFVSETEGARISISEMEEGPFRDITAKNGKVKLNHFRKQYFVRQEKENHLPRTQEITRTASNRLKRADYGVMFSISAVATILTPSYFLSNLRSPDAPIAAKAAVLSIMGVGVVGWGAVAPTPGRLYPKTIELDALIPIRTRDSSQLSITAGKHRFNLGKKGVRVRDYESIKEFRSGYNYETRDTVDNFEFLEDVKLYEDLSDILVDAAYGVDSAKATMNKTLKLMCRTRSAVFAAAEDKLRCEVRTEWALQTLDELQFLYDRSFTGNSEWLPFHEDELTPPDREMVIRELFVEALDRSFKKFVAMDTVQSILSSPVPIPLEEEEELNLSVGSTFAGSISDVVRSVITVKTNEGHGSGCIVTPDGYVITNAHVVEDDTTDLEGILSANVENTIPLEFIRMNEAMDLALLKIDTAGLTPMRFGVKEDIVTGSDVYAIGTPADLELGQTVTKGIISGQRKFGGHRFIQTDVAISPGNSGGALITPDGVLLGIVTAEMKDKRIDDIGFAIPAPIVEEALKIRLSR